MTCTLVTAFYPIRSKFTEDTYIRWATSFLTLEAPILLFTTPELADRFRSLRGGRPLHVVTAPFVDLYMWKQYAATWIAHYQLDTERDLHSPELYAIWAQKSVFMRDASTLNPFQTEYFFWCDIGAFRGPIAESVRRTFPMTTHLPKDRLLMSSVDRFTGIVDARHDSLVGGLWGGTGPSCCRWYSAYNAMLLQYIEKGQFAGKDQTVMLSTYLADRSLATIVCPGNDVKSDFRYPVNAVLDRVYVNPWFFLQVLLSSTPVEYKVDESYSLPA